MSPSFVRLVRILLAFFAGGWAAAMVVMVPDSAWTFQTAALNINTMRAACLAMGIGLALSPPLVFRRTPWWVGIFLGLLAGGIGVWGFFFLWPHDWQAGRWGAYKSAGLFLAVYWKSLGPVVAAFGALAAWLAQRPVTAPRWEQALDDDEAKVEVLVTTPAVEPAPKQTEEEAPTEVLDDPPSTSGDVR